MIETTGILASATTSVLPVVWESRAQYKSQILLVAAGDASSGGNHHPPLPARSSAPLLNLTAPLQLPCDDGGSSEAYVISGLG